MKKSSAKNRYYVAVVSYATPHVTKLALFRALQIKKAVDTESKIKYHITIGLSEQFICALRVKK